MQSDEIDRIERDRRKREAELLLLLLLLSAQARTAVRYAIRLDADPIAALRRVWLGAEHYPGAVTPIANAMLAAHLAGWNRTARLADVSLSLPDYAAGIYRPQAQFAASLALQTMADRLRVALSGAMTPEARLQAATGAFRDNGWTMDRPWGLAQLTGLQIVSGYGNGMMDAAFATPKVLGFRHVSVLDDATTDICNERNGLQLPKDDPYWLRNFVPLHFGCRSVCQPIMRPVVWSDWRPTVPPMAGFGMAPSWMGFNRRAA
jgi:hypothetical protein